MNLSSDNNLNDYKFPGNHSSMSSNTYQIARFK